MKKKRLQFISKRAGFTLIELVISIALTSIIAIVLLDALRGTLNTYGILDRLNSGYGNLNFAMEYIKDEVASATSVITSIDGDELLIRIDRGENALSELRYHHISYVLKDNSIYRYSFKSSKPFEKTLKNLYNKGTNRLISGIESFNVKAYDGVLKFEIKSKSGINLKRSVAIRCRYEK